VCRLMWVDESATRQPQEIGETRQMAGVRDWPVSVDKENLFTSHSRKYMYNPE